MDSSSPEYTVVHKVPDTQPDYNLMLLQKGNGYRMLYECSVQENQYVFERWYDIDELAQWGIRYLNLPIPFDTFIEMGEFIREYVGEARWILAVLANM